MRLAATVAAVMALSSGAAAVAAGQAAHVTVPTLSPFTVRGTGFRANERVRVIVASQSTQSKIVTATLRGRFNTIFARVTLGHCDMYTVRAKGNRGSAAVLRVIPECAPSGPAGEPDQLMPIDPVFRH